MKHVCLIGGLFLAFGVSQPGAFAQSSASASAIVQDPGDQKKRLIEQKIKLLDMLLNSPAAKSAAYGNEAETTTLVEHGQKIILAARQAATEARYDDASKALDEAMKTVGKATRRLQSNTALADSAQRKTFDDQNEQVASYRAGVVDLTRDPKLGEMAKLLLSRIDALSAEARQLASSGRMGEANKKLAEAYKLATEEIARIRQGHEVVMSLKFDSPADEFVYEQKRYASNEIMVDMMINEGKADGERRRMVDQFINEARRQRGEADELAQAGKHKDAIKLMEKAGGQLVRALQMMGVPVF